MQTRIKPDDTREERKGHQQLDEFTHQVMQRKRRTATHLYQAQMRGEQQIGQGIDGSTQSRRNRSLRSGKQRGKQCDQLGNRYLQKNSTKHND